MSDLGNPERVSMARQFLEHVGGRKLEETMELLAPNVEYRVLGRHALSGTFSGREAVAGHLIDIANQTSGRFHAAKWEDWLLGVHHVAVLVDIHIESDGRTFLGKHLILMRFDIHDAIDRVTVFFDDPDAAERFYGPGGE